MMTQLEALRKHLDAGHSVNKVTAYPLLGISGLAARITEIKRQNYPITQRLEPHVTPLDEVVYLMSYWKTKTKEPRKWTKTAEQ